MTKVNVRQDLCISCGACVNLVPDVFDFDSSGKASVITESDELLTKKIDQIKEAADNCPVNAIEINN
jgi:ferredoxin